MRARRRAHKERIKARANRRAKQNFRDWDWSPEGMSKWAQQHASCPKSCSNPICCGNPRKLGERTVAEMKSDLTLNEELIEKVSK